MRIRAWPVVVKLWDCREKKRCLTEQFAQRSKRPGAIGPERRVRVGYRYTLRLRRFRGIGPGEAGKFRQGICEWRQLETVADEDRRNPRDPSSESGSRRVVEDHTLRLKEAIEIEPALHLPPER